MKGLGDFMKQAQEAMEDNMKKMQEQLTEIEVVGESGAGMVKITMTGHNDVTQVFIDPSLVGTERLSEEKAILEDLVAAAVNDAVRKVEAAKKGKMSDLASVFNLPPGFKMPF